PALPQPGGDCRVPHEHREVRRCPGTTLLRRRFAVLQKGWTDSAQYWLPPITLADCLHQAFQTIVSTAEENILLGFEVSEESPRRNVGFPRDIGNCHPFETLFSVDLHRGVDQRLSCPTLLALTETETGLAGWRSAFHARHPVILHSCKYAGLQLYERSGCRGQRASHRLRRGGAGGPPGRGVRHRVALQAALGDRALAVRLSLRIHLGTAAPRVLLCLVRDDGGPCLPLSAPPPALRHRRLAA